MKMPKDTSQTPGDTAVGMTSPRQVRLLALLGVQTWLLSGCAGTPSVTIAGAYFPAWLLCALFAVAVAIVMRVLMITTRLAKYIPFQLAVCTSLGVIAALILWRFWVVY